MDISKARVLHISKYYYPFIGGTEQVARDIVNVFRGMEVSQKIICFNEDSSDKTMTCSHDKTTIDIVDGVEVYRCGYIAKVRSQAISLTYPKALKELMNEFVPDVVILHYPNPFVTHFLLKYKERDFKLLVYWHLDITRQKVLKHLFHRQNLTLIERADKILGATPKHLNESAYSAYFGNKKYLLPYMIDESNLVLSPKEKELGDRIKEKYKGKTLGFFIGRHVPYKGLTYLIKASKELGNSNVHFLIAGTGELTEELKVEAQEDPKISFIGRISDSERRSYLYAADIICFPSITRNEGFGLALAEGMYFGHPAVTFTIPGSGVNYVNLDGVTGIECPNCDYKAYAQAVKKLLDNPDYMVDLGNKAKERVDNSFTSQIFKENIIGLLNEL